MTNEEMIIELATRLACYEDTRPIDEDGLRDLGFSHYTLGEKFYLRVGHDFEVDHHVYVFWSCRSGVTFGSTQGRAYPLQIETFGQLAHLLGALGIGGGDHQQEKTDGN